MSAPMKTHENGKTPNKQEEKKNNKQNLVKLVTARSSTLGKQGKQKKNETAKKSSHKKKKYLKAPFKYEWSNVSEARNNEVMELIKTTFEKEGLCKPLCKRGGRKVLQVEEEEITEEDKKQQENWQHLIFGINAVTRSLEKKNASLVLVDSGVQPPMLAKHLVELCMINSVPGAQIQELSSISEIVGLRSVACVAFKPLEEIDNENLKNMIISIIKKVPKIKGPLEPNSIPPLDLSQESEEEVKPDPFPPADIPKLPPDDLSFSSLYVYKDDLHDFAVQDDFISLGQTFKRQGDTADKGPAGGKKLRYMDTAVGMLKHNPNRLKKEFKK